MPWPAKQARAIAMSYKQRGKTIPPEVANALSSSLAGKPMPHHKAGSAKERLVREQAKRRHHRQHHRR